MALEIDRHQIAQADSAQQLFARLSGLFSQRDQRYRRCNTDVAAFCAAHCREVRSGHSRIRGGRSKTLGANVAGLAGELGNAVAECASHLFRQTGLGQRGVEFDCLVQKCDVLQRYLAGKIVKITHTVITDRCAAVKGLIVEIKLRVLIQDLPVDLARHDPVVRLRHDDAAGSVFCLYLYINVDAHAVVVPLDGDLGMLLCKLADECLVRILHRLEDLQAKVCIAIERTDAGRLQHAHEACARRHNGNGIFIGIHVADQLDMLGRSAHSLTCGCTGKGNGNRARTAQRRRNLCAEDRQQFFFHDVKTPILP